jgi:transposase
VTSLAFVLTVGDPGRFPSGGRLASYLGLVPKRDQSGEVDKQCHISKAGSKLVRRNLVQAAHYIMGAFGDKECDLRKFGERIASRGGKNAKKRAVVAVARKLAVLMRNLWLNKEKYDPQYSRSKKLRAKEKAAA